MRRSIASLLAATLAVSSIASVSSVSSTAIAGSQDDRPPGGSPGNAPPPAPNPAPAPAPAPVPTYAPAPTYAPPPPNPPGVGVGGSLIVKPPPTYAAEGTPSLYDVYIRDEAPGLVHRVSFTDGRPVAACTGNCTFRLPPGQYQIEVDGNDQLRPGKKKIDVAGPTVVDITPGSKGKRTAGLVLGVVGSAAFLVGLVATVIVAGENDARRVDCGSGFGTCQRSTDVTGWLVVMLAGATATTVGWVMFGSAGTKIKPSAAPAQMTPEPPQVALSVLPTKGGATFGLTLHF